MEVLKNQTFRLKPVTLLTCIFVGMTLGCNDPQIAPPELHPRYWGNASATINGEPWEADPFAAQDTSNATIGLGFVVHNDWFIEMENLTIVLIPNEEGVYSVHHRIGNEDTTYAIFAYVEYDVIDAWYDVVPGDTSNWVNLSSIDESTAEVMGSFNLTLAITERPGKPDAPDTLRIRDGSFHTRIID